MRPFLAVNGDFVPPHLPFYKMNGLGNDFVLVDGLDIWNDLRPDTRAWLARAICDRRFGVGADQMIILDSRPFDARNEKGDSYPIKFVNADGTEAGACGNGTRCATLYLAEKTKETHFRLAIGARTIESRVLNHDSDYALGTIRVNMGKPDFDPNNVPVLGDTSDLSLRLESGETVRGSACSMGNPHFTISCAPHDDLRALCEKSGALLSTHASFTEGANVSFYKVLSETSIEMEVWERGTGRTLACGSGACAVFANAHRRREIGNSATVRLAGGTLDLSYDANGDIVMQGAAARSFRGSLSPADLLLNNIEP